MINLNDNQSFYQNQNFKDIHLSEKKIDQKEFDNCTFSGCNFSESEFYKCKFYECKFTNCNLTMIKVNNCSFFDTLFENSKAIGINWTAAAWPNIKLCSPIHFYKCALNYSSFFGLWLREIVMTECTATEVDFREADCTSANFTHTDFSQSLFNKTNLTKADFTDALSYSIDVFLNEIKKAKFSFPEAMNLLRCLDIQLIDF